MGEFSGQDKLKPFDMSQIEEEKEILTEADKMFIVVGTVRGKKNEAITVPQTKQKTQETLKSLEHQNSIAIEKYKLKDLKVVPASKE